MQIDVDYFKKYNDLYGHDYGDAVFRSCRNFSGSERREGSFIARFGGEEFVILLVQQREQDAAVLAENIKQNLEQAAIEHKGSEVCQHLTVSIGYASTEELEEYDWSVLFQHADQALYTAKHKGRNQALSYTESLTVEGDFKRT